MFWQWWNNKKSTYGFVFGQYEHSQNIPWRYRRVIVFTTENAPLRHKHISIFYFCWNYCNVCFLYYFDNESRGRGSRYPTTSGHDTVFYITWCGVILWRPFFSMTHYCRFDRIATILGRATNPLKSSNYFEQSIPKVRCMFANTCKLEIFLHLKPPKWIHVTPSELFRYKGFLCSEW